MAKFYRKTVDLASLAILLQATCRILIYTCFSEATKIACKNWLPLIARSLEHWFSALHQYFQIFFQVLFFFCVQNSQSSHRMCPDTAYNRSKYFSTCGQLCHTIQKCVLPLDTCVYKCVWMEEIVKQIPTFKIQLNG